LQPSAAGAILSRPARGSSINAARLYDPLGEKTNPMGFMREEMKNCIWLKPKLVAQIEFTEWTPDGHLRHSKSVG
jgi:bifunctional non-homologous end joining protein LigD